MGDHYKILATLFFSAAFVLVDATDQSSYTCMSGQECLNAVSTNQQGGVTYCCKAGHVVTFELNGASWSQFGMETFKNFVNLLLAQNSKNKKSSNEGGVPRTDIMPDGVSRDQTSDVNHRNLETSHITEVGAYVKEERLSGQKTMGKPGNFVTDEHYPTSNYDANRDAQRQPTGRNKDVSGGDQGTVTRGDTLVKYNFPASYIDTRWEFLFPGPKQSRKLIRRDVTGGERERADAGGNSQWGERANPSNPNPVTPNSFSHTDVAYGSRKPRCLCRPEPADILGTILKFLKRLGLL